MKSIAEIGNACCGCGACHEACALQAIELKPDIEGFFSPVVNEKKCVSCGRCLQVCPQVDMAPSAAPRGVYAAYAESGDILKRSSSGGLFSVAGLSAIQEGAAVYGASLDERDWYVRMTSTKDEAGLPNLCGSKYVQCMPSPHFQQIYKNLAEGKKVLFSGCPCQVAAVRRFIGESDTAKNLTTIDIICHGVPSPAAFQAYMAWLKKTTHSSITRYRFRTKEQGWGMRLGYRAGQRQRYKASLLDPYNYHFLSGNDYRECCYGCRYASDKRQGDMTIGDYWGVLKEHPDFYSEKGVSLMLVNTDKGQALFDQMKPHIKYIPSTFEKAARHNVNLIHPSARPSVRSGFYDGIATMDPVEFVKSHMRVRPNLKSLVKASIPWQLKCLAQRFYLSRRTK